MSSARLFGYLKTVLLILVLAYVCQILWMMLNGKAQDRMGTAFEAIAHETLLRQHNGSPQMQVATANAGSSLCPIWNFEGIWGRCVVVVLNVRDYLPDYQPMVEREAMLLVEQLRKPCVLLSKLGLPNRQQLSRNLECGVSKKPFRLRVLVNAVEVNERLRFSNKPHAWAVTRRSKISEYHTKGAS